MFWQSVHKNKHASPYSRRGICGFYIVVDYFSIKFSTTVYFDGVVTIVPQVTSAGQVVHPYVVSSSLMLLSYSHKLIKNRAGSVCYAALPAPSYAVRLRNW